VRRCLLALVALVALSLAAAAAAATITVGAGANGQQRTLHRGDTLVVQLATNPSTGYSWLLTGPGKPVLALVRRATMTSPHALPGAPATLSLRFRAVAAGKATLRLVYRRPWEAGKPPARTFTLRVVVTP
jgi:inhibitor of cysteine peptidase